LIIRSVPHQIESAPELLSEHLAVRCSKKMRQKNAISFVSVCAIRLRSAFATRSGKLLLRQVVETLPCFVGNP
jgi:hypothetical protein